MVRNPSSNSPEHPRMIQARLRDRQALELRARGLSFAAIAERMGVTPGAVRKAVKRGLAALVPDDETVAERRQMMQTRIDHRRLEANQVLARPHPVLYQGQPVDSGDGRVLDDDGIKLAALDRLAQADRDESRLWALDKADEEQPVRVVDVWVQAQQERIAKIRLMPRPVDAGSRELEEREEG